MELTEEVRLRRIEVIRDLKDRLAAGHIRLTRRAYIDFSDSTAKEALRSLAEESCQPSVDEIEEHCPVCLRGGLLLSKIRRHNQVSGYDLLDATEEWENARLLSDTFDRASLGLIESAFMESTQFATRNLSPLGDAKIMKEFAKKVGDDLVGEERLERIAQVILEELIASNGEVIVARFAAHLEQGATPSS